LSDKLLIKEIKCKSLLNPSKLGEDYCLNPYVGCAHNCLYCYAEYLTRKFTTHKEPWGEFIDVKINAPQVLIKEVLRKPKGSVFISSLTDPYQPIEKKYELTRKCLEILLRNNFSVWIQTKSALVTRDVDLLKKFKEKSEVCFTITNLEKEVKERFEPFSSSNEEKFKAIENLKSNEIKTSVFFGPVLPFFSDKNLEVFIKNLKELEIDCLWIDRLNLKPGLWEKLEKVLKENYPNLLACWRKILFENFPYYSELKQKIVNLCEKYKIKYKFCY
jgi:DNA repair photolyase